MLGSGGALEDALTQVRFGRLEQHHTPNSVEKKTPNNWKLTVVLHRDCHSFPWAGHTRTIRSLSTGSEVTLILKI